MKLEKDNYTKQEVEEILKGLNKQVADLTANLAGATEKNTEKVKEIDTLKKDNLNNSIKLEMAKNGLDENLFDLVSADDLEGSKAKITKLMDLQKKQKIDNSYKPEGQHKTDDAYSIAEKNKDVEGMLKSKFSKLFQ